MSNLGEIRRQWDCYSHPPEEAIQRLLGDAYETDYLPLVRHLSTLPYVENDFATLRDLFGGIIYDLHHDPQDRKDAGPAALYFLAFTQEFATQLGVLSQSEIEKIQEGEQLPENDGAQKYLTQEDLKSRTEEWHQQGKIIGLVHGSFDPPHFAHARLLAKISQYCDVLLVGVDNDAILRQRKGDDRPRFPLAARIWELGLLPSVDGVFVLPVKDNTGEAFEDLYRDLHIRVLGGGLDNVYRQSYEERIRNVGGVFIPGPPEASYSSTKYLSLLQNNSLQNIGQLSFESTQESYQQIAQKARRRGVLRDFEVS